MCVTHPASNVSISSNAGEGFGACLVAETLPNRWPRRIRRRPFQGRANDSLTATSQGRSEARNTTKGEFMTPTARVALVMALAVGALTGCGGDDDSAESESTAVVAAD